MKAPFPWFGGKRRVAEHVWSALGPVDNYIEPFAGSLAVLLARPAGDWESSTETVNDKDAYLSNFWRALAADPEGVAKCASWPVNETDLIARHLWLVNTGRKRISKMEADPDFFDVKVAGWWVWGINAWIGSGWCAGNGPWQLIDGKCVNNRQLPHLGNPGQGVNRQLPHLGNPGQGVNRKLPHLGNPGRGDDPSTEHLLFYFSELAERLRRVRVCCGDWSRVVMEGAMAYGESIGVFLDPPYSGEVRKKNLYVEEGHAISKDVRTWAIEHGNDPRLRIVLAGYSEEHEGDMPKDWRMLAWVGNKSYGTTAAVGTKRGNDANRNNERLWFSPHCQTSEKGQIELNFTLED